MGGKSKEKGQKRGEVALVLMEEHQACFVSCVLYCHPSLISLSIINLPPTPTSGEGKVEESFRNMVSYITSPHPLRS
jgi:hypothetical protein